MTDEELKRAVMEADLELKRKQAFWETPRNLAILVTATVTITAAVFGLLGFKIGQTPPPPQTIIIQQPQAK